MFTIENHRLQGRGVLHYDSPNRSGPISPTVIVEHYTAGTRAEPAVAWLCNPKARASAHLVIGDDGSVYQLGPFNVRMWHAGLKAGYPGIRGVNGRSIGIEHTNAGLLTELEPDRYESLLGEPIPRDRVGFDAMGRPWHTYSSAQIETSLAIHEALTDAYPITELMEHSEIDPRRKIDPGPLFPLELFRAHVPADEDPPRPTTWPAGRRVLRNGARGDDVAELQGMLRAELGRAVEVDGIFGPQTEHAVRAYQRAHGLVVDGIVGPQTWATLGVTELA